MLILLTGPTGCGKTSLALSAQHRYGWRLITTLTTRPPRAGDERDTKKYITPAAMSTALSTPNQFRGFHYEGHKYATPLLEVREAARCSDPVSIIDWVHSHPENLDFLGKYVIGIVLFPAPDVLETRLREAHRQDRITRALSERQQIASSLSSYIPPWTVVDSTSSVDELTELLDTLVNQHSST